MYRHYWDGLTDYRDFDRLCNRLLYWHVSRAVVTYEGPGRDLGIDAELRGAYQGKSGHWIFQRKYLDPATDRSRARAEIKRQMLGTPKKRGELEKAKAAGAGHFALLTNVELTPGGVEELRQAAEALGLTFAAWHRSVLDASLARYPFLWPGRTPMFLPFQEHFAPPPPAGTDVAPVAAARAHQLPLRGRDAQLAAYDAFLANDDQQVLLVHGASGAGVTRFLKECAARTDLAVTVAEGATEWQQRFVRPQVGDLADHLDELQADGRYVLFLDRTVAADVVGAAVRDLAALLTWPEWRGRLQLVVGAPTGALDVIRGNLPLEPLERAADLRLPPLPLESLAAVTEDLGVPAGPARDRLVLGAAGQPVYFLVEAVRLWGTAGRFADLTSEDFARRVLDRQVDEICRGDGRLQEVLTAVAALSPVRQDADGLLGGLAAAIGCRADEVSPALDTLVERGAVDDRASAYRVRPTVLGEHLLRRRCLDARGRPTGYHERLLEYLAKVDGGRLVEHLASIQATDGGAERSLLAQTIAETTRETPSLNAAQRTQLLRWFETAAVYCPVEVVAFAEALLAHPCGDHTVTHQVWGRVTVTEADVLADVPGVLRHAMWSPTAFGRALELLARLALLKPAPPFLPNSDPREVLKRACGFVYGLDLDHDGQGYYYSDRMHAIVLDRLRAWSAAGRPEYQILAAKLAPRLLARETQDVRRSATARRAITITRHAIPLAPEITADRSAALDVLLRLAESPEREVRLAALRRLPGVVAQYGQRGRGRGAHRVPQLEAEYARVRAALQAAVATATAAAVDWTSLNAVAEALDTLRERGRDGPDERAIRASFADRPDYGLFEMLIGEHQDERIVRRWEPTIRQRAATIPAHWTPATFASMLSEMLETRPGYHFGPVRRALLELLHADQPYGVELLAYLVTHSGAARDYAYVLLAELRVINAEHTATMMGLLAANEADTGQQLVAARTYEALAERRYVSGSADAAALERLASSPDARVRTAAAAGLPVLAQTEAETMWRLAEQLAAGTGDAAHSEMYGSLVAALAKLPDTHLEAHAAELAAVLERFVPVPDLDRGPLAGTHIQRLLRCVGRYEPLRLIGFLGRRVQHAPRARSDGDYEPVPDLLADALDGLQRRQDYGVVLAATLNWLLPPTNALDVTGAVLYRLETSDDGVRPDDRPSAVLASALLEWTGDDAERLWRAAHALREFDDSPRLYQLLGEILARGNDHPDVRSAVWAAIGTTPRATDMGALGASPPGLTRRMTLLEQLAARGRTAAAREFAAELAESTRRAIAQKLERDAVEVEGPL